MKRYLLTCDGYVIDTQQTPIHIGKVDEIGVVYIENENANCIQVKEENGTQIINYIAMESDEKNKLLDIVYGILCGLRDRHHIGVMARYLNIYEKPYDNIRLTEDEYMERSSANYERNN